MAKRLKIAMVAACPFPYPRGTPIRIFRMAEALSGRGHEVHVVTYHLGDPTNGADFEIHRIPNIRSYRRYSPGPTYQKLFLVDPFLLVTLLRVLRRYEIDLIHAHHYEGLFVSLLARAATKHPVVYDAHTLLESELPFYRLGLHSNIRRAVGRYLDRALPKRANHTVTVTERIRDELVSRGGIAPRDVTFATNGVESERFDVEPEQREKIANGKKVLVYAGNLAPYQRIDLLLEAFGEVLAERRDVRLMIVSNSDFAEYEPLAIRLGIRRDIDIVPSDISTLPGYLANADAALNPRTDCDGIPQKLLNYMAAGNPIVSFEGSAQILEHGKTGFKVEDGNTAAFSGRVLQLLRDSALAAEVGANAKRRASEYTWEKTAEKVEAAYERVLDRRNIGRGR